MATYSTEIQFGGFDAPWQDDSDLVIEIKNRKPVIEANGTIPTGTQLTWSSANGNGSITFYNNGQTFVGSAQFPGEGPVGYRGTQK